MAMHSCDRIIISDSTRVKFVNLFFTGVFLFSFKGGFGHLPHPSRRRLKSCFLSTLFAFFLSLGPQTHTRWLTVIEKKNHHH